MKRVFCPRCDAPITLSAERLAKAMSEDGRLDVVCPSCGKQLRAKLRTKNEGRTKTAGDSSDDTCDRPLTGAMIRVVENVFGYAQQFLLVEGINRIGRRNKGSEVEHAIFTADPSMERHHCVIYAERKDDGSYIYSISDDNSRVGTFLLGEEVPPGDCCPLENDTVITLGATTLLFTIAPEKEDLPEK